MIIPNNLLSFKNKSSFFSLNHKRTCRQKNRKFFYRLFCVSSCNWLLLFTILLFRMLLRVPVGMIILSFVFMCLIIFIVWSTIVLVFGTIITVQNCHHRNNHWTTTGAIIE